MRIHLVRVLMFVLLFVAGMKGQNLRAEIVVGNCQPNGVHFDTIQTAVYAAPAGATIQICPGTYPEQITISTPVTLKGKQDGNNGAVVISLPPALVNADAQIHVQNAGNVTISNLTVDGTSSSGSCAQLFGIWFEETSGTIKNVLVREPVECKSVPGVVAYCCSQNSVSIQDSSFQNTGIQAAELDVTIKGNTVVGTTRTGTFSGTGILLGAIQRPNVLSRASLPYSATVSDNVVADSETGIMVVHFDGPVTVASNTLIDNDSGIRLEETSPGKVTWNRIAGSRLGIEVVYASLLIVQHNEISNSAQAAVYVHFEAVNNTIMLNRINGACAGIAGDFRLPSNITAPNTYFNVRSIQQTVNSLNDLSCQ